MNNKCDNCGNPYRTAEWEDALEDLRATIAVRDAHIEELVAVVRMFMREIGVCGICNSDSVGGLCTVCVATRVLNRLGGGSNEE